MKATVSFGRSRLYHLSGKHVTEGDLACDRTSEMEKPGMGSGSIPRSMQRYDGEARTSST